LTRDGPVFANFLPGEVQDMSFRDDFRDFGLQKGAHVASILGVILGIISLWFVYAALRHQTRVSMAANSQALVPLTQPVNLELAKDPSLSALWYKGLRDYDSLSSEEKARYQRIWVMYLNVLENAYYQHQQGLIEDRFCATWDNDLVRNRGPLSKVWPELKPLISEDFAKHVDSQLKAQAAGK
jgi:hypothetical protein